MVYLQPPSCLLSPPAPGQQHWCYSGCTHQHFKIAKQFHNSWVWACRLSSLVQHRCGEHPLLPQPQTEASCVLPLGLFHASFHMTILSTFGRQKTEDGNRLTKYTRICLRVSQAKPLLLFPIYTCISIILFYFILFYFIYLFRWEWEANALCPEAPCVGLWHSSLLGLFTHWT